MRVDFESSGKSGRLIFSSDESAEPEPPSEVVNRLADQAATLMTRNLRQYGEEHPSLRAMAQDPASALSTRAVRALKALLMDLGGDTAGCVEKADLIERCEAISGGPSQLAAYCVAAEEREAAASAAPDAPPSAGVRCVCGGRLERLSGRQRCRQLLTSQFASQLDAQQLERVRRAARCMHACDCDPSPLLSPRPRQMVDMQIAEGTAYVVTCASNTVETPLTYADKPLTYLDDPSTGVRPLRRAAHAAHACVVLHKRRANHPPPDDLRRLRGVLPEVFGARARR